MGQGSTASARANGRDVHVAMWRIEADPVEPGRLLTRDEQDRVSFVSNDGARSWVRSVGVGASIRTVE